MNELLPMRLGDYAIVLTWWLGPAVAIGLSLIVFSASNEGAMVAALAVKIAAGWANEHFKPR